MLSQWQRYRIVHCSDNRMPQFDDPQRLHVPARAVGGRRDAHVPTAHSPSDVLGILTRCQPAVAVAPATGVPGPAPTTRPLGRLPRGLGR